MKAFTGSSLVRGQLGPIGSRRNQEKAKRHQEKARCNRQNPRRIAWLVSLLLALCCLMAQSCGKARQEGKRGLAVFVPGELKGSPIYEQMAKGAKRAADEAKVGYTVFEAGYNQAEWQEKLNRLASSGGWAYIVSSNPALPALCQKAKDVAPKTKFILADASVEGDPAIASFAYDQTEQGYLAGYLAGLYLTQLSTQQSDSDKGLGSAGIIVAQRYDSLDQSILPGFRRGLADAAPGAAVEERMVGNWYDASRAMELARVLVDSGAKVLFPVAGGAGQGVISAAQEKGAKLVWFDSSAYGQAAGTIIGCAVIRQETLVYEKCLAALRGRLEWGKATVYGIKDGYVDFDDKDPLYGQGLSEATKASMAARLKELREVGLGGKSQ